MNTSRRIRLSIALGATALGTALLAPAAFAAVITPSTTADEFNANPGACSLREAIWAANNDSAAQAPGCVAGSGPDTVSIPGGTYVLTRSGTGEGAAVTGDLDITEATTLRRAGSAPVTVDAAGIDRVLEVSSSSAVTIDGLTIRRGSSGGIRAPGSGAFTLLNSTVSGNTNNGFGGGLAVSSGSHSLVNTTVSGNSSTSDGGGIDLDGGTLELINSTITGNTADSNADDSGVGGGVNVFAGSATARNSIIAGNVDASPGSKVHDCDPPVNSQGGNVIGNTAGCAFVTATGDVVDTSALLGPLGDNGGPTATHALLAGSPALDGRSTCPANDQRGLLRSLGGSCDAGSYELARCGGVVVNRVGTGGADTLRGTAAADGILGLGGNDRLIGLAGKDALCGGPGKDRLIGGAGNDKLFGGPGKDKLFGGKGKDRLVGQGGKDTCVGGKGKDRAKKCEKRKSI